MLRAVVETNNKRAYIDFNSSWDKIHRSLNHIGIEKDIVQLKFCDSDIKIHFTKDSGDFYNQIKKLVSPHDTYFMLYDACKILQSEDKNFLNYLQKRFANHEINKLSDIQISKSLYQFYNLDNPEKSRWDFNVDVLRYELIIFFNKPVIFTSSRIDRSTLPKGLHCYEVQYDDNHRGIITMIGNHITVNFWGSILSTKKIGLDKNGYRKIDEKKDIKFLEQPVLTLKDYLDNYSAKSKNKER